MLDKHNKDDVIVAAHLIPGWYYLHELGLMWEFCKNSEYHVEIGTFCGKSLFVAAMAMKNGSKIMSVDAMNFGWMEELDPRFRVPFIQDDRGPDTPSWPEQVLGLTVDAVKLYHPKTEIEFIREPSVRAATLVKERGEMIDSIHIDGNHSYDGVTFDIESWYPLLKPGGIMFGHDYAPAFDGVMEAVNNAFSGGDIAKYPGGFKVQPDTRVWFHFKPDEKVEQ